MKIRPLFHVLLLEPYVSSTIPNRTHPPPPPVGVDSEPEYEVEEILDSKYVRKRLFYLVKWKGYSQCDNSWQPASFVKNLPNLVKAFHSKSCWSLLSQLFSYLFLVWRKNSLHRQYPQIELHDSNHLESVAYFLNYCIASGYSTPIRLWHWIDHNLDFKRSTLPWSNHKSMDCNPWGQGSMDCNPGCRKIQTSNHLRPLHRIGRYFGLGGAVDRV